MRKMLAAIAALLTFKSALGPGVAFARPLPERTRGTIWELAGGARRHQLA